MATLVSSLRNQARHCANLGSPLYASLLTRIADNSTWGGVLTKVIPPNSSDSDAAPLRLLGAVHALVLTGRAPQLERYYPSVGGSFSPEQEDDAAAAFIDAVSSNPDWIADWLTRPPQTNEVGRAALLLTGLRRALSSHPLPVRLFEIGASAGLNLLADQFRWVAEGTSFGPPDSPVVLDNAWRGDMPQWLLNSESLVIVDRQGCDLTPIDPTSTDGALKLRAYVWPDQGRRFERLQGALTLTKSIPTTVKPIGAGDFLRGIQLEYGTLTVVWHSVMQQYVPAAEWAQVEAELDRLARAATPNAPFVYLKFEPEQNTGVNTIFRLWYKDGTAPAQVLAEALPHGLPAWTPES